MTHMKLRNEAFVPGIFNLMDRFLTDDFQTAVKSFQPSVNIIENEKSYDLSLVAPGLQKSDFKIAIEKNLLTISYEKKEEHQENTGKFIRQEYNFSSFKRSFTLNEKLNADGIAAKYDNGILHIMIPKAEVKEVEVKSIVIA